ncbi:GNAT family N-acetyltransferase [Glaciimonas sp. GG7]
MTHTPTTQTNLSIRWAEHPELAAQIADFFCAHADVNYISHMELQEGRAVALGKWHPKLWEVIHTEVSETLENPANDGFHDAIACAWLDEELVGIAFLGFNADKPDCRFAVLEDMIVSPTVRGRGIGQQFIDWLAAQIKAYGVQRLFLESGITNASAHHFFERTGFKQTSVVMMRDL